MASNDADEMVKLSLDSIQTDSHQRYSIEAHVRDSVSFVLEGANDRGVSLWADFIETIVKRKLKNG